MFSDERSSLRPISSTPKSVRPPRASYRTILSTPKSENGKVKSKKYTQETMINKIPNFFTEMTPNRRPANSQAPSNVAR